ncbi:hypothetical protein F5884DRAFT_464522 [Xylogone sp. PMI_703]|nr:hypothetical protein F5884DRAFT_464522 [Xylogone sp. PMI_703]
MIVPTLVLLSGGRIKVLTVRAVVALVLMESSPAQQQILAPAYMKTLSVDALGRISSLQLFPAFPASIFTLHQNFSPPPNDANATRPKIFHAAELGESLVIRLDSAATLHANTFRFGIAQ